MKTALRSYHPVPSLQKSDGNLQDAPRIKNCLKAALLPFEFKTPPPSTPAEIREKAVKSLVNFHGGVSLMRVTAHWPDTAHQCRQSYFRAIQRLSCHGEKRRNFHLVPPA